MKRYSFPLFLSVFFSLSCAHLQGPVHGGRGEVVSCMQVPSRFAAAAPAGAEGVGKAQDPSFAGMVHIPGGTFSMGGDNEQASGDEYPKHDVTVDAFWMDATEVTNAQFARFVAATGYVTTAERKPDWNELKKGLPAGTPPPHDSVLVPASLVFTPASGPVDLHDYTSWWRWQKGADWKHPEGPGSSIEGRENYPVVHVS